MCTERGRESDTLHNYIRVCMCIYIYRERERARERYVTLLLHIYYIN